MAAIAFGEVPLKVGKPAIVIIFNIMFVVYVLNSMRYSRYYIGHTKNMKSRLAEHNRGKVRSTKAFAPWKVVYTETYGSKSEAFRREMEIKKYKSGNAFKKLILKSEFG